jgi:hypothetical protein
MKKLLLILIGILLNAIDIIIPTGVTYPTYTMADDIGVTFQEYVIGNIVGKELVFDLLPDALGLLLIPMGVTGIIKYNKTILKSYPFIGFALATCILVPLLPYLYNGKALSYSALIFSFLSVIAQIFMEYFIIKSVVLSTNAVPNRRNNIAVKVGWIISIACKVIIFLTGFIGIGYLTMFYGSVYILSTIFYVFKLYQSGQYLTEN